MTPAARWPKGRRMSSLHFVGGEKGGVGKSVVARLLAQLFIDRALPFTALDADLSHRALARYYADYTRSVDLDRLDSADQILDSALGADRLVLVDLPAQSHRALQRWIESTDVLNYAREMGVQLVSWHVTDGGFDSVSYIERVLAAPGDALQHVVVKNQGRSKDFSQFDASPAYQRLLEGGGHIVTLPELDSSVMYKIDRFGSSFWAAINTSEGQQALSALERRRAKLWLERAQAALEAACSLRPATERVSASGAPQRPESAEQQLEPAASNELVAT
ncbi:mobilization protein [Sorangium sp. So ce693]|uniref:mobilization protein n=1 Tax=Sorangium sp. So ce693 TaxID=3133318 RepID=UPI003F636ED4